MSDQGFPVDPAQAPPGMVDQAPQEQPQQPMPQEPPAPPSTMDELVKAIEAAARKAQIATGPTASEDVWHYGQGAYYFAQAVSLLTAPANPAAAQADARAAAGPAAPSGPVGA